MWFFRSRAVVPPVDIAYIDNVLNFINAGDVDTFCSEVKKHENFLEDIALYIKNQDHLIALDVWSSLFISLTLAFRVEQREKEGKILNTVYYKLVELISLIVESEDEEKDVFQKISSKLTDSQEYGRELIVYRALRYSIQYNDEEGCKKILDSKLLGKGEIYFCSLDFHDESDPVDQSKLIKWFLYRYDISNAIRYLSLISWKWTFLIKLLHWLVNKRGTTIILLLFFLYCNVPFLRSFTIPERYFYYLEFIVIFSFLIVYLVSKATSKAIDETKALLLLFQISLPRLWGAILMGLITVALSEISWTFPLRIKERYFFIICILTFISAFLYLYLEVSSSVVDSKQAIARTSKIVILGLIEAFFLSFLICQMFSESVMPDLISSEGLIALKEEYLYNISNIIAMPKFIPNVKIYPPLIILWSFLSLLIGMFIQNFWDRENLISSPFDKEMTLGVAPRPGIK